MGDVKIGKSESLSIRNIHLQSCTDADNGSKHAQAIAETQETEELCFWSLVIKMA